MRSNGSVSRLRRGGSWSRQIAARSKYESSGAAATGREILPSGISRGEPADRMLLKPVLKVIERGAGGVKRLKILSVSPRIFFPFATIESGAGKMQTLR